MDVIDKARVELIRKNRQRLTKIASVLLPGPWIWYRARSNLVGSDHPRKSSRISAFGITNGSDGRIIILPHLITSHFISTMGCNFTQLSDSNTRDPGVVPTDNPMNSTEFRRNPIGSNIESDRVRYRIRGPELLCSRQLIALRGHDENHLRVN
jgi:hypothetical protein